MYPLIIRSRSKMPRLAGGRGLGATLSWLGVAWVTAAQAFAQPSPLEEIVITATRTETPLLEVPQAISVVGERDLQLGRQQLGMDESLNRVPGLFMQNRYNFAQDLSVSIRGFGARASFGIRGVKVFSDGIPVTLPDGQSGTDDLDMGSAQKIEVVRGPSASLYGTAAGGIINVVTEEAPAEGFTDLQLMGGDFGHRKLQLKTGGQNGRLNYLFNASHLYMEGFRDHSQVEHNLINSKFRYTIDDSSDLMAIVNVVDSPKANDSGGITRGEATADRRQAQSRNVSSNAGESFDMQRLGLVYNKTVNAHHSLTLRTYSTWKDFQTFLPIGTHIPFVANDGVVEFNRIFFGGGARYTYTDQLLGMPNTLTLGMDIDIQRDDRQRYLNNAGSKGDLAFDQLEQAESLGFYFRNEMALNDQLLLTLGGRFDNIDLSVNDRFLTNGDQSGQLDFNEFSPAAGLNWKLSERHVLYTNVGTAFETPTFTELGTPAQDLDGANLGGFNNVTAQQATSFEVGSRGNIHQGLYYDVAVYTLSVNDEIANIFTQGNRAFFENADTDRQGLEAQLQASFSERLDLTLTYTLSDFTFDNFDSQPEAVGAHLPGIPRHQFYAELNYSLPSGTYVIWDMLAVGRFYADNANTEKVDSSLVSNLRLGGHYAFSRMRVSPFIGINNVFDEDYFSNVRSNAFGGRAFEPAPGRHIYGGVNIHF